MRKSYLFLIVIPFILVIALITIYLTHKTCYLNLSFYDVETTVDSEVVYTKKMPSYMDVIGVNLKGYSDETRIADKQVINSVIDYLNNVPLVPVAGYFDKSTRVFVIKELSVQGYDFIKGNNEKSALLRFFDEDQIEIGTVKIYNEKYICDPNYRAYKVCDEATLIIRDLESLTTK